MSNYRNQCLLFNDNFILLCKCIFQDETQILYKGIYGTSAVTQYNIWMKPFLVRNDHLTFKGSWAKK